MEETYRPLFHEIFTKINNAKDKPKKVAVLRQYRSASLEMFLKRWTCALSVGHSKRGRQNCNVPGDASALQIAQ